MRLYHPTTLSILSKRQDIPKRYSGSVWSEVFKWKASGQKHPKVFITDDYDMGIYLSLVYNRAIDKGCNLDKGKVPKLGESLSTGFDDGLKMSILRREVFVSHHFDKQYLFSDACSLYLKSVNIFPDIFGNDWQKYCPVISHEEILRQVTKTLNKK